MKVHSLANVMTDDIGEKTMIWQYAVVLKGAKIGSNCNINCHTFIENDVSIGDNVTIKPGVYLWDGMIVQDNVFIGPNVTFTNDKFPRSKQYPVAFQNTVLQKGCSIGANATVLGGVIIGSYAIVGAGSVVTKNVPANALVVGSPAKIVAWLDEKGNKLKKNADGHLHDPDSNLYSVEENFLRKL